MRPSRNLLIFFALGCLAAPNDAVPETAVKLLSQRCFQCHNEKMAMSGLRLHERAGLLQGGAHGPAIKPGAPAADTLLFQVVNHTGKIAMPPGSKLSDAELTLLQAWIEQGAPYPAQTAAKAQPTWWAFQIPKRPDVPALSPAWGKTPIDAFIHVRLRQEQLSPAAEADRPTLIRRATLDLHGLPPTAAEIEAFVRDTAPNAYEKVVDRLLASPRYGEKWGQHWLDLVRYGDTGGFEQDPYMLYAWRYRDYVIKSLNEDKPYDRFVKEQIAGDELWPDDPEAQTGTGYFTVGANRDMLFKVEDINRVETLTDYADTTGSVFMGLSVGCARCHDHKFDPIPQKDYYRLQAIFVPAVKTKVFLHYNNARSYDLGENTRTAKLYEIGAQLANLQEPYRKKLRGEKLAKLPAEVRTAFETDEDQRTPQQKAFAEEYKKKAEVSDDEVRVLLSQEDRERLGSLERKLANMFRGYAPGPFAPGVVDIGREAPVTYLPAKGKDPLGEKVEPGFLSALGGGDVPEPPPSATSTGRRKALAEWLANPQHPLTARVMVNRIWQFHFGRGLVATPSDYGLRGAAPSHPELLEWLATEFVSKGWSMKQMHRLIMTSSVYRQAATPTASARQKDPDNVYLSHYTRRRLEAEEIRDAVLQASGVLNLKMFGRPVVPRLSPEELYGMSQSADNAWIVTADTKEQNRRSVYLFARRTFRMPSLEVFDRPEGVLTCPRRDESTTAPQSLTLLNGGFTMAQAKTLGAKLAGEPDAIALAWRQVLGRAPRADERSAAEAFIARQAKALGSRDLALVELGRGLFNINEFLYVE